MCQGAIQRGQESRTRSLQLFSWKVVSQCGARNTEIGMSWELRGRGRGTVMVGLRSLKCRFPGLHRLRPCKCLEWGPSLLSLKSAQVVLMQPTLDSHWDQDSAAACRAGAPNLGALGISCWAVFVTETVLCSVGHFAAPLASTYERPVAAPRIITATRVFSRYCRASPVGQCHPQLRATDREDGAEVLQLEICTGLCHGPAETLRPITLLL